MTKLATILLSRGLNQTDLYNLIEKSEYKTIGKDRINRIIKGKHKTYTITTAITISKVLNITIDSMVDDV